MRERSDHHPNHRFCSAMVMNADFSLRTRKKGAKMAVKKMKQGFNKD